ncbi:hypothetical protein MTO96_020237 [Rhipicephalus appendiculatus]
MSVQADEQAYDAGIEDTAEPDYTENTDELGAHDLLVLVVDFVIEFGLSWKAAETLQKLLIRILRRKDLPASKFLLEKSTGVSVEAAKFHFYCKECMILLAETSGNLRERNEVEVVCPSCNEKYSSQKMLLDGQFFLSLPIEQQLSSLLAAKDISSVIFERLEGMERSRQSICCFSGCADAPARALMQNMAQFNGYLAAVGAYTKEPMLMEQSGILWKSQQRKEATTKW